MWQEVRVRVRVATLMAFDGQIKVKIEATDFDDVRDVCEGMRAAIPASGRKWNPARDKNKRPIPGGDNTWIIGPAWLDKLDGVLRSYGFEVVTLGGGEVSTATVDERDPYRIMFGCLSDVNLKKLYLTLAKAYHPDRGGDAEKMRDINEGWRMIREERGL